ncbi:MAG: tyrosine-type recombinase/integrase [Spirochaetia bacterium]|jgi:integrase
MGKTGRPFTLYTRPRKRGKPVYYVRYRKPEGGWTIAQCTGQTSEGAAETYALEQLRTGAVAPTADEVPTFAQWAAGFWDIGGRYDRARRARGYVLSPTYLRIAELTVRKHLSPTFDRIKLTDLSSELLENHFLKVFEEGKVTPRTVNSIMSVLRAMLREAHRLGRIPANPMERVSKFKEQPRVRGVLSLAELRALFGPRALEKVWKGRRQPYLIAMIAACTGARHGELRGLRRCDVTEGMLSINQSFCARTGGFKEPKWGSTRVVSMPRRAEKELREFMSMAEDQSPEALVFHGTRPDMAIRVKPTLDALYEAMNAIGITPEARKKRFLDVHALRHTFVTCMRGQVPDFRLQRATGHRSTEMLERYTAAASQPEDFIQLRAAQDTLFPSPGAPAVQGLVDRLEGEVNVGTCLS